MFRPERIRGKIVVVIALIKGVHRASYILYVFHASYGSFVVKQCASPKYAVRLHQPCVYNQHPVR